MIKFKELGIRNFMSYGNAMTVVDLDFKTPTLIVGKNYDSAVDGQIDSNGAGKSSILNAISYAIADRIMGSTEKNGLINNTNKKNMEVYLLLEVDGVHYKIHRFRKNSQLGGDGVKILRDEKNADMSAAVDITPDSIKNANDAIAKIIGMSFPIFSRIGVFSARIEPFLGLDAASQREFIEELFGITELSEKADSLKEIIKNDKSLLQNKISTNEVIAREHLNHSQLVASAKARVSSWDEENTQRIADTEARIESMSSIPGDDVEVLSKKWETFTALESRSKELSSSAATIRAEIKNATAVINAHEIYQSKSLRTIQDLTARLESLPKYEYDLETIEELFGKLDSLSTEAAELQDVLRRETDKLNDFTRQKEEAEQRLQHLADNKCPFCKQDYAAASVAADTIELDLVNIRSIIHDLSENTEACNKRLKKVQKELLRYEAAASGVPSVKQFTKTLTERESLHTALDEAKNSENPYASQVDAAVQDLERLNRELSAVEVKIAHTTAQLDSYTNLPSLESIEERKEMLYGLREKLSTLKSAINPHLDQLADLEAVTLSDKLDDEINALQDDITHKDFLVKLLTKKDSFIRKALLQKGVPFLNGRLRHYLDQIGLPHKVAFNTELGVTISQFGKEIDFGLLSSGQQARINLSLAFAFRDVLQMRHGKLNFCILDECLDVGLGSVGVQMAVSMLKRTAKEQDLTMFVITHKDEVSSSFDRKLQIELRGGFSSIQ